MFTGLIESVGELAETKPTPAGFRLRVESPLARELTPGDSIAVNGVCLTVVSSGAEGFHAEVSPETRRVTTLGSLPRGARLNLERSLKAEARLGGHFVQGHVDAMGTIEEVRQEEDSHWVTIAYPVEKAAWIVRKGSIAVDGISFTVAGLDDYLFDVQVIPFTWHQTNISDAKAGGVVNLEFDILGKYVARAAEVANRAALGK